MIESSRHPRKEYLLSAFIFVILAVYSYAKVFKIPYIGFDFNPQDGRVIEFFSDPSPNQTLRLNDRLLQVGETSWGEYITNLRKPLFDNVQAGDSVPIRIQREDQEIIIEWIVPGASMEELVDRLATLWLPYLFWVAGSAALFLIRPKDTRWRLLVAYSYLTALWLMAGLVSTGAVWQSALVMRALIWLSVPVYLHMHWIFPRPLSQIPVPIVWGIYIVGVILAGLEWFQITPPYFYAYGFILAIGGSLLLLFIHAITQPDQRRDIRVLAIAAVIIILPTVVIGTVAARLLNSSIWNGWGTLLSLPALPGAYFYVIYRRQLGGLELRANRIITLYLFLILLFITSTLTFLGINVWIEDPGVRNAIEVALVLLIGLVIVTNYDGFQRWVEKSVLAIPLPPTRLLEAYSSRVPTSLNEDSLTSLLMHEILPSLLIRQSALVWLRENDSFSLLCSSEVDKLRLPSVSDIPTLLELSGVYRQASKSANDLLSFSWIRLILPLSVEEKLVGFWLLGRRDPDDWYDHRVISVLQSIANQTAIALVHITLTEHLRTLYRTDIERQETERARLARDIHDDVLNNLAILATSQDYPGQPSQQIQDRYQKLVDTLRETIHNLRPAMLNFGLHPALEELADELTERVGDSASIHFGIAPTEAQYDPHVEQHLFRIVQQACENALRHAQAKNIYIRGRMDQTHALINVVDDGVGFSIEPSLSLEQMLTSKHYGLVGMYERAALIGAELKIQSAPGHGTEVTAIWNLEES